MSSPKHRALKNRVPEWPIMDKLPEDYKGTSRMVKKGKNKGKYQVFDLNK